VRPRRLVALSLVLLAAAGCTSDRVALRYGLEAGRVLHYRLSLEADVHRTLSGEPGEQRLAATFDTSQTVLELLAGGRARARITLEPRSLTVDGRAATPGPNQEFVVVLNPDGSVIEVESSSGAAPEVLAPVGIDRLLPRLRPVLPPGPVSPGDRWGSDLDLTDASGSLSLDVSSRLSALGLSGGHRAALIRSSYTSPVSRREAFANAIADIEGRDRGAQEAWFALDGFLVRASGDSVGDYDVTFRPPGGDAGVGTVTFTLGRVSMTWSCWMTAPWKNRRRSSSAIGLAPGTWMRVVFA
jgi:hypothetical protein